jgi:23S rRNA pseudouridine2605 synthase
VEIMIERLQKYMADCGVASRRKCEEIILSGKVRVNNEVIKELGYKINREIDKVYLNDKLIEPEENKVYIALNKPVGYISSVKDERGRKTILDLVKVEERIYPIGRLDYDTSGLILLTNDGEIYNKLIHPRQVVNKVYIAEVEGILKEDEVKRFKTGVDIGGYITAPANLKILGCNSKTSELEIKIHEGKNRQVRRMCEAINHPVINLKRISVGEISLGKLKLGEWRKLSNTETEYLKKL